METITLTWDRTKNVEFFDICVKDSQERGINAGSIKLHKKLSNQEKSNLVELIVENYASQKQSDDVETGKLFYTFDSLLKKIRQVKKLRIGLPPEFKDDLEKLRVTSTDITHIESYLKVGEQLWAYVTCFLSGSIRRDDYARRNEYDLHSDIKKCREVVTKIGFSLDELETVERNETEHKNAMWTRLGLERGQDYSEFIKDPNYWNRSGRIEF